jgi:hypothetical protein
MVESEPFDFEVRFTPGENVSETPPVTEVTGDDTVGTLIIDEALALNGTTRASEALPTPRGPSRREIRLTQARETLASPELFEATVLSLFTDESHPVERLPRKEIVLQLCGQNHKKVPADMKKAIHGQLSLLAAAGVIIEKTYPRRTKKIRDTVYYHLADGDPRQQPIPNKSPAPTQQRKTPTPPPRHTPTHERALPTTPGFSETQAQQQPYDDELERMLGPFKNQSAFKPRDRRKRR